MSDWIKEITTTKANISVDELNVSVDVPHFIRLSRRVEIDESEIPAWAISDNSQPKISGAEKRKISREDFEKKFAKNGKVVG